MNLFEMVREENLKQKRPLAERRKPRTLEDFMGQEEILGKGKLLRRLIEADRLTSIILVGPSGVGKTSLARIISNMTRSTFVTLNAVTSGVRDIKDVVDKAKRELETTGHGTILFVDEIHRFNKAQQDALLPHVEAGIVVLIGATTENPYFEVIQALLSRSMVFEMFPLSEEDIKLIVDKAIAEDEQLSIQNIILGEEEKDFIAQKSMGDARRALNILELAVLTTPVEEGKIILTKDVLSECTQKPFLRYDRDGDYHYDVISAFIKSVRGSDPQAALYYLAQMLVSGEDPKFIARRLVILASEDIGLAHPEALNISNAAFEIVNKIGMPEAQIALGELTIYLCLCDKSNSAYLAIKEAMSWVRENGVGNVPEHLMDSTKKRLSAISSAYNYPHDDPRGYFEQDYLPEGLREIEFYSPKYHGREKTLTDLWEKRKKKK
mgnify:CR=1 FL=1